MVSVSLNDFVATGVFGPVALGSASEAVKAALGEPQDTGRTFRKCLRPNFWKYGDVEFVFDQHVLTDMVGGWATFDRCAMGPVLLWSGRLCFRSSLKFRHPNQNPLLVGVLLREGAFPTFPETRFHHGIKRRNHRPVAGPGQ
jgi:hypothetical protein